MVMYYISAENPSFFKIIEYKFFVAVEGGDNYIRNTMKSGMFLVMAVQNDFHIIEEIAGLRGFRDVIRLRRRGNKCRLSR